MAAGPDAALAAMAGQAFATVAPSTTSPLRFTASIAGLPRELSVVESVLMDVVQNVPIDLSLVSKDVRFDAPEIADLDTVGGMPIADALTATLDQLMDGTIPPPGVPGLLGTLTGLIPLPVQQLVETTLSASAAVRWAILDENGQPTSDFSWRIGNSGPWSPGSGQLITPSLADAMTALELAIIVTRELTVANAAQPTVTRFLRASLNLTAGGYSSGWIDLPNVPIVVPVVGIPTLLAMFAQGNLQAEVFIAVPADSALSGTKGIVSATLGTLRDLLDTVSDVINVADFFVGIDALRPAIDAADVGRSRVEHVDAITNFEDYTLREIRFWPDETWDNTMSSLVMIGPLGRRVEGFNAPSHHTNEGAFEIVVNGPFGLLEIRELHEAEPTPTRVYQATFRVTRVPPGERDWARDVDTFGNEMSGIRFS